MALIMLTITFAVLYYALRLLINTTHVRRDLRRWHQQRLINKSTTARPIFNSPIPAWQAAISWEDAG